MFRLHVRLGKGFARIVNETLSCRGGSRASLGNPLGKLSLTEGTGRTELIRDLLFEVLLVTDEAEEAHGTGPPGEGPAAKYRGDMGA